MKGKHILALAASAALLAAAIGAAKEQAVILKDGRRITGEVVKTDGGYEVQTVAGPIVVSADQVLRIEDVATPRSEFERRLAKVDRSDPKALYDLAVWARKRRLLRQAQDLLEQALKLKPDFESAQLQLRLVKIELSKTTRPRKTTTAAGRVPRVAGRLLLRQEDIYRIRLLELGENDNVVIEFRNRVLDRFVQSMRGAGIFRFPDGRRRFYGAKPVQQARYILDNTDREDPLRDDILVKTDPAVMRRFRTRIWPIIQKNCATSSCHGGVRTPAAAKFRLYPGPATNDRLVYTNFYILHKWQRSGRRLINRGDREMSLLLQYGLPSDLARLSHPVPTNRAFRNREDRNYRLVENWIGQLRYPLLPPGYRIKLRIPGMGTTPTTTPAPAPRPAPPGR